MSTKTNSPEQDKHSGTPSEVTKEKKRSEVSEQTKQSAEKLHQELKELEGIKWRKKTSAESREKIARLEQEIKEIADKEYSSRHEEILAKSRDLKKQIEEESSFQRETLKKRVEDTIEQRERESNDLEAAKSVLKDIANIDLHEEWAKEARWAMTCFFLDILKNKHKTQIYLEQSREGVTVHVIGDNARREAFEELFNNQLRADKNLQDDFKAALLYRTTGISDFISANTDTKGKLIVDKEKMSGKAYRDFLVKKYKDQGIDMAIRTGKLLDMRDARISEEDRMFLLSYKEDAYDDYRVDVAIKQYDVQAKAAAKAIKSSLAAPEASKTKKPRALKDVSWEEMVARFVENPLGAFSEILSGAGGYGPFLLIGAIWLGITHFKEVLTGLAVFAGAKWMGFTDALAKQIRASGSETSAPKATHREVTSAAPVRDRMRRAITEWPNKKMEKEEYNAYDSVLLASEDFKQQSVGSLQEALKDPANDFLLEQFFAKIGKIWEKSGKEYFESQKDKKKLRTYLETLLANKSDRCKSVGDILTLASVAATITPAVIWEGTPAPVDVANALDENASVGITQKLIWRNNKYFIIGPDRGEKELTQDFSPELWKKMGEIDKVHLAATAYNLWRSAALNQAESLLVWRWRKTAENNIKARVDNADKTFRRIIVALQTGENNVDGLIYEMFEYMFQAEDVRWRPIIGKDDLEMIKRNIFDPDTKKSLIERKRNIYYHFRANAIKNGNNKWVIEMLGNDILNGDSKWFESARGILKNSHNRQLALAYITSNQSDRLQKELGIPKELAEEICKSCDKLRKEQEKQHNAIVEEVKKAHPNDPDIIKKIEAAKAFSLEMVTMGLLQNKLLACAIKYPQNNVDPLANNALAQLYSDMTDAKDEWFRISSENLEASSKVAAQLAIVVAITGVSIYTAGTATGFLVGAAGFAETTTVAGGVAAWAGASIAEGALFYQTSNMMNNVIYGKGGLFENAGNVHEMAKSAAFMGVLRGFNMVAKEIPALQQLQKLSNWANVPKACLAKSGEIIAETGMLAATDKVVAKVIFNEDDHWTKEEWLQALAMVVLMRSARIGGKDPVQYKSGTRSEWQATEWKTGKNLWERMSSIEWRVKKWPKGEIEVGIFEANMKWTGEKMVRKINYRDALNSRIENLEMGEMLEIGDVTIKSNGQWKYDILRNGEVREVASVAEAKRFIEVNAKTLSEIRVAIESSVKKGDTAQVQLDGKMYTVKIEENASGIQETKIYDANDKLLDAKSMEKIEKIADQHFKKALDEMIRENENSQEKPSQKPTEEEAKKTSETIEKTSGKKIPWEKIRDWTIGDYYKNLKELKSNPSDWKNWKNLVLPNGLGSNIALFGFMGWDMSHGNTDKAFKDYFLFMGLNRVPWLLYMGIFEMEIPQRAYRLIQKNREPKFTQE